MNNDVLLEIKGLHARVEDKEILKGVDLTIRRGEVHAVMGPNGAGRARWARSWRGARPSRSRPAASATTGATCSR